MYLDRIGLHAHDAEHVALPFAARAGGEDRRLHTQEGKNRFPNGFDGQLEKLNQHVNLCHGRESALNGDNSRKILLIPGKRLRHDSRPNHYMPQCFVSLFVAVTRLVRDREVASSNLVAPI
jgi:hypothetical protein